ncbi:hypothetical protein GCM10023310_70320 [Paenibacillus vulneris]|uniref:Uncharacterized protein n=1 Tax=Paenibacillus vulneris TaxID=1133364 RepID=A0ABW3UH09_9BACL
MFGREVKTYEKVYHIRENRKKPKLKIKRILNYEDSMEWVNRVLFNDGEIYVTPDKIEWGKEQVLNHMIKEAEQQFNAAKSRMDFVTELVQKSK